MPGRGPPRPDRLPVPADKAHVLERLQPPQLRATHSPARCGKTAQPGVLAQLPIQPQKFANLVPVCMPTRPLDRCQFNRTENLGLVLDQKRPQRRRVLDLSPSESRENCAHGAKPGPTKPRHQCPRVARHGRASLDHGWSNLEHALRFNLPAWQPRAPDRRQSNQTLLTPTLPCQLEKNNTGPNPNTKLATGIETGHPY